MSTSVCDDGKLVNMLKLAFSRTCDLGTYTHTSHSSLTVCLILEDRLVVSSFKTLANSALPSLSLSSLELQVLQTHAELLQK